MSKYSLSDTEERWTLQDGESTDVYRWRRGEAIAKGNAGSCKSIGLGFAKEQPCPVRRSLQGTQSQPFTASRRHLGCSSFINPDPLGGRDKLREAIDLVRVLLYGEDADGALPRKGTG